MDYRRDILIASSDRKRGSGIARRRFLTALGAVACGPVWIARAQTVGRIVQIGYLGNATPAMESKLVEAFRRGMTERGYHEGKNLFIHYRWAEGSINAIPALLDELIALNVQLLVTAGTPAAIAAKKATTTIPIVTAAAGDAVGTGLVTSLARPGGNITGISTLYTVIEGKRMQLLHELVPRMKRIALLMSPANQLTPLILDSIRAATQALHVSTQVHDVRVADDFDRAFAAMAKQRPDALSVQGDRTLMLANRTQIVRFAAKQRLPAIYAMPEFVDEGGLIYYGPNTADMFYRTATYVDKILKGAKPGELPMEQPTLFELHFNRKTANVLGLKTPRTLIEHADRIID